jgi:hypothetical protein
MRVDTVTLCEEPPPVPEAVPLLKPALLGGRRICPSPVLRAVQQHAQEALARLPESLHGLDAPRKAYSVRFSERIITLREAVRRRLR